MVPTVQVKELSAVVMFKVPPLSAVMKAGGPGVAAKVNVTVLPLAVILLALSVPVMDVTSPTTLTEEVALRP